MPLESKASDAGLLKVAAVPVPFVLPLVPVPAVVEPANVVTTPEDVIFLILLFPVSATYKLPLESTVMPHIEEKAAAVPVPSVFPAVDPANVELAPEDVIFLINTPLDTNKLPLESIAIPLGVVMGE